MNDLFELQTVDLEIVALEEKKNDVPTELIEARQDRKALDDERAAREAERNELQSKVNEAEAELARLRERIKLASSSALQAGTAKEASQFQNQELQFSTRAQEIEEDILPLMEELEGVETKLAALDERLASVVPALEELEEAEQARLGDINSTQKELEAKRDSMAEGIDPTLLKQYDSVRKAKRGLGIVKVTAEKRCGACNVQLPLHVQQKLKRGGDLVRCPSCGRILATEG